MEIVGSTFNGNSGSSPAIAVVRAQITNSTVSGNTNPSSECVAGVTRRASRAASRSPFSTIADNASSASCASSGVGIGATRGKVTLIGSILVGNFDGLGGNDCGGIVRSAGGNVVGYPTGCMFVGKTSADVTGVDPNPRTAPGLRRPDRDARAGARQPGARRRDSCPATDQRGAPRVRPCDAGAFEL